MEEEKQENGNEKENEALSQIDLKRAVREAYEDTLATQGEIAAKFNISRQTLNKWANKGEWTSRKIFNEIRAMYETLGMSIKELAKKYKMNENYLRYIKTRQKWEKRRITKDLEEKEIKEILGDKLTEKNMDLFLDTKKEEVKEVLKQSLDHLNLDPIVLEAITETTSDELLLKAMNTAYIKKQILFCTVVARGELIKMIKKASLTNNEKDSANIIVAAEKVSKLFIDAGVSLFGKEQIQVIESHQNTNLAQMNMSDLLALANSSVGSESVGGVDRASESESEATY
ncbi:DNA-binding protein [Helicobacter pylori]|uniref:DNA-binding protein n=1 Tax=Helicobacter pylori TaxID=210 RepID=UPI000E27BD65|nr:DNA-binding protein [Helicobacter pylori]RDY78760.1 DNA-binding protein [Helicobacter pylori]RDY82252.1 DNA-binding protein [Helicobacter pylori]RDY82362.1 DNA-binding protein [Helicobacter pylori]WQX56593.1 DNA-binding protein [Helicobacter pylori]